MGKSVKFAVLCVIIYAIYFQFVRPDWYTFTDPAGHFTAQFPNEPKHSKDKLRLLEGYSPATLHRFWANNDDDTAEYFIVKIRAGWLRRVKASKKDLMDRIAKAFTKKAGLRVVQSETVTIDGNPGVELRVMNSYGQSLDVIVTVAEGSVYVVGAGSHDMSRLFGGRGRFLDAFEILPAPAN